MATDLEVLRIKLELSEAERGRLQAIVDRSAEAGGNWFARAITAEAERDRLRAAVAEWQAAYAAVNVTGEQRCIEAARALAALDVSPTGEDT